MSSLMLLQHLKPTLYRFGSRHVNEKIHIAIDVKIVNI